MGELLILKCVEVDTSDDTCRFEDENGDDEWMELDDRNTQRLVGCDENPRYFLVKVYPWEEETVPFPLVAEVWACF